LKIHSYTIELAIDEALNFHEKIGIQRKSERLHQLRVYWMSKVMDIPGVNFNTSLDNRFACGIGNFNVNDANNGSLRHHLFSNGFYTIVADHKRFNGVRVTPNIYTTTEELDAFSEVVHKFIDK